MDRLEQVRAWGAYAAQVRGRVPERPPPGAVVERDGPLVRTHYGTHGTVGHPPLTHSGRGEVAELVRRQQEAFGARNEPVEWKAYGADPPVLAEELEAAGFTADPERSLMAAEFARLARATDGRVRSVGTGAGVGAFALAGGPHARPLAEVDADGCAPYGHDGAADTVALLDRGRVTAVGWAGRFADCDFVEIGGLTGPYAELVPAFAPLGRKRFLKGREAPYCVAEADGELRTALTEAGFAELTTVRTYRWHPGRSPARTRPVRETRDTEEGGLWDRLAEEFGFRPSMHRFPGFHEPVPSVTWSLAALDEEEGALDALDVIAHRALTEVTCPGEPLVWLDWQHTGYVFDPRRVGGPGEPRWPGAVYPDGDYYLYLHPDLLFGTFGHPWEQTLCVWGAGLLAAVEGELTGLLGEPLRRRDTPG
ncbi:DUF2716 domain-containing protein [Streptomyces sp. NPDC051563]|uniref:DUF2716 domain-containing protein n=1 Tax=Streptomyces sp. NPDC051563 TaxID=3365659 RepID=UPI00378A6BD0